MLTGKPEASESFDSLAFLFFGAGLLSKAGR
jgi:hypothetical protein